MTRMRDAHAANRSILRRWPVRPACWLTAVALLLASHSLAIAERGFVRVAFDNGVSFEVPGSWICVSLPPFTKTIAQALKSRSTAAQIKSGRLFRFQNSRPKSNINRGLVVVTAVLSSSAANEKERADVVEGNAHYLRKYDERRRETLNDAMKRLGATVVHYTPATAGNHGNLHYIVTYADTSRPGSPLRQHMSIELVDLNAGLNIQAAYDKQDAEDVAKIINAIVSSIRVSPRAGGTSTRQYRD